MQYRLKIKDLELWGWVKAKQTEKGITINEFIIGILIDRKYQDELLTAAKQGKDGPVHPTLNPSGKEKP